jgi:hypothetical protein
LPMPASLPAARVMAERSSDAADGPVACRIPWVLLGLDWAVGFGRAARQLHPRHRHSHDNQVVALGAEAASVSGGWAATAALGRN